MPRTAAKNYIAPTDYTPDVAIPPGATIKETLNAMGMTQAELAERLARPASRLNQIIQGKRAITVDTARSLERVLPYPADFWLNLERNYRLTLARLEEAKALEQDLQWMRDTIPVAELAKRGHIPAGKNDATRFEAVLKLFSVGSRRAWEAYWSERIEAAMAFRRLGSRPLHIGRIAAWLRLGEIQGQDRTCQPFNKRKFETALKRIRAATTEPPGVFEPLLDELADCGVVVSLVKEIPGAGVSGATWWPGGSKAHIQLSLLYKTDDQFWFSFFHEAGHVVRHGKDQVFLEGQAKKADRTKEDEADRFASDLLIPPAEAAKLPSLFSRNRQTLHDRIKAFANRLGIAPGIVVGRMQHDGLISPAYANTLCLKRKFEWAQG